MALISYAPGGLASTPLFNSDITLGPTLAVTKVGPIPATGGTLPFPATAAYPMYNTVGRYADVGEIADCLNQLVARIENLEAIISTNPAYGVNLT